MFGHEHGHDTCASHCGCGCGGMLSVEDEIKALEVHRQHMKLQLEMIEKRIAGLKHVAK
ncbi:MULTISPECIES: DUF5320 domain-containing protein [unclassified Methanoregula]|uniref:DUF5320 domain-containing protein n=1 Tax=unclassified Methanoregula TaxID=2649730 RepID=UPI0009C643CC|nr:MULTISPECIES: DUF5320 domain-containing protein [unclassified Methanoregula]OPX63215.1 MAG: hypothetical protein A4E33_01898 [Methanoregula sp. PtaB.Bin085]OPY33515.1 MAG: hypothetical protein A4E34_01838 [Methanoregula sp. PtaU1.Bin006]